ncbi:MAG: cytochrome P460 family protein [Sandaracinaceae bacterium]|nr:cytochrome P460 family protein [Sandaracinaceae bacterium]
MRRALSLALAAALSGCPGEPPGPAIDPLFPVDYASTWTEVRDCRLSVEHTLVHVRVWANPVALGAYERRDAPFPDGSILLKEEFTDSGCTERSGWTVMAREAGFAPTLGDWHWQDVLPDRRVVSDGTVSTCFQCHEDCGVAPDGHDWTCAVP